jgi:hypothetical protein
VNPHQVANSPLAPLVPAPREGHEIDGTSRLKGAQTMRAAANYSVGTIVIGPLFDQGFRFLVRGPGDTDIGHFKTEEEAQREVDALNREEPQ